MVETLQFGGAASSAGLHHRGVAQQDGEADPGTVAWVCCCPSPEPKARGSQHLNSAMMLWQIRAPAASWVTALVYVSAGIETGLITLIKPPPHNQDHKSTAQLQL